MSDLLSVALEADAATRAAHVAAGFRRAAVRYFGFGEPERIRPVGKEKRARPCHVLVRLRNRSAERDVDVAVESRVVCAGVPAERTVDAAQQCFHFAARNEIDI